MPAELALASLSCKRMSHVRWVLESTLHFACFNIRPSLVKVGWWRELARERQGVGVCLGGLEACGQSIDMAGFSR